MDHVVEGQHSFRHISLATKKKQRKWAWGSGRTGQREKRRRMEKKNKRNCNKK